MMNRRTVARVVTLLGASVSALPALAQGSAIEIYVSPSGNDRDPGTQARPVRTLPRAQALVRKSNARADVAVILGDGTFSLSAPLIFRRTDGGMDGHTVTWKAAQGAHPVVSGGMKVTGFKPYDQERRIWVADVPKGLDARQVWVDGTLAERPWIEVRTSDLRFDAAGFTILDPKLGWLSRLARPDRVELEATGFFTDRVSPVKAIADGRVTMHQPAWDNNTWGYDTISKPIFPDDSRLFLVNALEFIGKTNEWHSRPYQWVIDPQAGKLYLRMGLDEDIADRDVVVPRLEALISIAGTADAPVERLRFEGLRFSHTSWLGPSRPTGYANQQSGAFLQDTSPIRPADAWQSCGWGCPQFESMRQKWHQMPAAVQVASARDVVFAGNTFSQIGQVALGIGNDATANLSGQGLATQGVRVIRNRFAVLSGGAIMAGGVRQDAHHPGTANLTNRDLAIEDNTVTTVSQDYKDNAAILTTYVTGTRIAHNDVSDAPYDGIAVGWGWGYNDAGGNPNYDENLKGYLHNTKFTTPTTLRDTVIEGNRIHGVKTWFMDGGAIYNLSANPGAVIRGNHIFDIGNRIAIYLDEGSKHFAVTGNVVETGGKWLNINTAGAMFKRRISTDNTATGNWHTVNSTGGRWLAEIGNVAKDNTLVADRNWPAEARTVIANAGVRP